MVFLIDPRTGRLIWAAPTRGPEANSSVVCSRTKVSPNYPYATPPDTTERAKSPKSLRNKEDRYGKKNVRDGKFCGVADSSMCLPNPYVVPRLTNRLGGVNTVVAERTSSRFRNYARMFSALGRQRRHFLAHLQSMAHNESISNQATPQLNPYVGKYRKCQAPYVCYTGPVAKKKRRKWGSS